MEAIYVALIKGPVDILGAKVKAEKFVITDEDIDDYLDEGGEDETSEDAIQYYKSEYVAEWEQRLCTVTLLSVQEFEKLHDELVLLSLP